eukprot:Gregarina_sp_Pseudo_9__3749@NODE_3896_length_531_cov_3_205285_g3573_i0_p1_GENE_NODE_3896_length_531_cov_3_205285_g3573_i0NODE_3896_length_531_cov_3_205285_g3573_i0_p1_ORF_typecomplete_len102_score10_83Methyltransf_34/PF11312_8/0_049_NODE_3896_length_531_cov_3_205285_g3573_i0188493
MGCSHHFLCLGAGCPAEAILVTPQSVYRYDLAAFRLALECQNWTSVVSNLLEEIATSQPHERSRNVLAMANLLRVPVGLTQFRISAPHTGVFLLFPHVSGT